MQSKSEERYFYLLQEPSLSSLYLKRNSNIVNKHQGIDVIKESPSRNYDVKKILSVRKWLPKASQIEDLL